MICVFVGKEVKHYAEKSLFSLVKKKFLWGEKYCQQKISEVKQFEYLPKTKKENITFKKNLIFNLLILPNIIYSFKLYKKSKDFVSFLFPGFAFLNTLAYGSNFLLFRK